jgi:antitoxin FitA
MEPFWVNTMTTITVKHIPDALYERLKLTAKTNHRSINSEIIACILVCL